LQISCSYTLRIIAATTAILRWGANFHKSWFMIGVKDQTQVKTKKIVNNSRWFIKSNFHTYTHTTRIDGNSMIQTSFTQWYVAENMVHISIQRLEPDSATLLLLGWTECAWICNAIAFHPTTQCLVSCSLCLRISLTNVFSTSHVYFLLFLLPPPISFSVPIVALFISK